MTTRILLLAALAAFFTSPAPAADRAAETVKLAEVLRSNASLFDKARACQQLGEFGTAEAVPALAALLGDPQLSAYARSGLENIPDPSAAAALRDAVPKLRGLQLMGAVNSLGAIRDPGAVPLLGKLAADANSGAAREALLALGKIGSTDAIAIVARQLADGPEALRAEAAAACLLAAEAQLKSGKGKEAAELNQLVRQARVPVTLRAAATRGAIVARTTDRISFLLEQLHSNELAIRNAALMAIREVRSEKLAAALNKTLSHLEPDLQVQVLLAIADCHDADSVAAVATLVESPQGEVRATALRVLGKLGAPAAGVLLTALGKNPSPAERAAILAGLRSMPDKAADDRLLSAVRSSSDARLRADLIPILDSRSVRQATPLLLDAARDPAREVALAALAALKSLAGPDQLPALVAVVKDSSDATLREAAEAAVAGVCSRFPDNQAGPGLILEQAKTAARPVDKGSWIRVLTALGYAPALPTIETAAASSDEPVALVALGQLGQWPDPSPMETLLKTAETGSSPALRSRALQSAIDLASTAADESLRPEPTIVAWLQRANSAAANTAEKRRVLGILGRLKTAQSFQLINAYLDHAELRTEAASAVVQIAPAFVTGPDVPGLRAALEKIAATATNADLRDRALQVVKALPKEEAISLFDGQSLSGWEGNTNVWRVRDGVIVGGSLAGNPRNEFLATTRSYTNFVLRLEYKLAGTEGFINGGVQLRSVRVSNPPTEMSGYQADIGAGYSGCLYDESRRNKFLVQCPADTIKRLEKPGDWNRYEIRCAGPRIQLWLNGERTADYTEAEGGMAPAGLIGLQIHGDCKAEISFRNLAIREL